jgi:hypothetical protein
MKQKTSVFYLSVALALVPLVYLCWFLASHAVNVPFWDQWEIVPIIHHIRDGHIYFNDFMRQHNEHRLFFPRIFMVGTAFLTQWDTRYEVMISVVLAALSFFVLYCALQRTSAVTKQKLPFLLLPGLGLVWFSLAQQENWMWGWQIQWYLNVLGVMIVVWALTTIKKDISWVKLAVLVAGAVLAQYSLGNGTLLWPLAIAAFVLLGLPRRKTLWLGAIALVCTAYYYIGYGAVAGSTSKSYGLRHPLGLAKYFFTYMGRSLTYGQRFATVVGLVLVLAFVWLAYYLYRYRRPRFMAALPWFVLGGYALGSATITALSRLELGQLQAYSSRYTTISSLFVVSLLVLYTMSRDVVKARVKGYRDLTLVAVAVLSGLLITNYLYGIQQATKQQQYLADISHCTKAEAPYDVCLESAYPDKYLVGERIQYLKSIHWGGY